MKEQKTGKLRRFVRWLFDLDGPSPAFSRSAHDDASTLDAVRPLVRIEGESTGTVGQTPRGRWDRVWVGMVLALIAQGWMLLALLLDTNALAFPGIALQLIAISAFLVLVLRGSVRARHAFILTYMVLLVATIFLWAYYYWPVGRHG